MIVDSKAINIFDFDGTLTTETWPKFWVWVEKFGYSGTHRNDALESALIKYRKTHVGSHLETFFGFFNDLLHDNNEVLTLEELMLGEKYIQYNPGLLSFLEKSLGSNYIVSGGIRDFLSNLQITKYFSGIYGTSLTYNSENLITGIGKIMTDNDKIKSIQQILSNNSMQSYKNVYYIGDGYSDRPAMTFVHNNGGKAIFVYHPDTNDELSVDNLKVYEELNKTGIIDYCVPADYRPGSQLFSLLQNRIFSFPEAGRPTIPSPFVDR